MIKSIFIDYTGTIIQEKGEDLEKLVLRIWKNCNFKSPEEIAASLWDQLKMMEEEWFDLEKYKKIMGQLKKYMVSIYEWQKKKLDEAGLLYNILEGRAKVLDSQAYDSCFGLMVVEEQAVEHYIL